VRQVEPLERARELNQRARDAMNGGRPRQAEALLLKAQALLGDGADGDAAYVRARVMITLASAEFELYGLDGALGRLSEAETAPPPAVRSRLLAPLHNQRGVLLLRAGRLRDAVAEFDLALAAPGPIDIDKCGALLNRSVAHMDLAALDAAAADLRACARGAERSGLTVIAVKATHNLGFLEFLRGNLPVALDLMDRARELDPTVSPGIALLGKAEVLTEAGLLQDADDALARAAAIFSRARIAQDLGEAELERARCALALGDVVVARALAARARDRFRRRGNERWRRSAELVLLMSDLAAGRPGKRLAGPALRLRREFESAGTPLPARTAALIAAEAHLSAGQVAEATAVLHGTPRPGRNDPITARLHDRYVRARLSSSRGRVAEARRTAGRGLAELAAHQASFGSTDASTAAAVLGRRLAELDVALAGATGKAAVLFAAAERTRAVTNRLPAVVPPADPQAARLLAELRQTIDAQRYATADPAALRSRRRELERAIKERGWTRTGAGQAVAPAGIEQVRAALEHGVLVQFVQVGAALHAVTVDRRSARMQVLGAAETVTELVRRARADLDVAAQPRLPAPMRAAVLGSFRRTAERLDAELVAPLAVGAGPVVVVGTGVLGQLPWGLLPSLRGVPVVVAPSATAWLRAAESRARRRRFAATALSGPDLQRAHDEAKQVADIWDAAVPQPTCSAALDAMARSTLLHVAAHGVHQTENPLFSSVRLADGPLFAYELDRTARTPEHVVLSACELGLATVRPGDEALGLTSVLLRLGTRSVVAGVARVGDELAEQAMIDYHRRLVAGADSASALAGAVASVEDPVPFVCFGSSWRAPGFGAARRRRVP